MEECLIGDENLPNHKLISIKLVASKRVILGYWSTLEPTQKPTGLKHSAAYDKDLTWNYNFSCSLTPNLFKCFQTCAEKENGFL